MGAQTPKPMSCFEQLSKRLICEFCVGCIPLCSGRMFWHNYSILGVPSNGLRYWRGGVWQAPQTGHDPFQPCSQCGATPTPSSARFVGRTTSSLMPNTRATKPSNHKPNLLLPAPMMVIFKSVLDAIFTFLFAGLPPN